MILLVARVRAELVDLSHTLDENARNWPVKGFTPFKHSVLALYDEDGAFYTSKDIEMTEHIGTHMDAPYHFGKTAWDLASIPIENFVVPVVKINVREKSAENRDYLLTVQDLQDWEEKHGAVPENAVVLMETGWGDKYTDTEAYFGTARDQKAEDFDYDAWIAEIHFPGFSAELATKLLTDYKITGVGIDTASIDAGVAGAFPVHFTLEANNKYGLENLCCLDKVPESGATLIAIPPKMTGGSGFTLRVLVDTDSSYAYKQSGRMSGAGTQNINVCGFLALFYFILYVQ